MNFLLIAVSLALGVALQFAPASLPDTLRRTLTRYIFWLAWPAVISYNLVGLEFQWQQLWLGSVGWVYFLSGWVFFILCQKLFHFDRKSLGALILVGGLGNTAFLGYPVISSLYGSTGLDDAIILDILGSFIVVNTLGISLAFLYSGDNPRKRDIFRKILSFPPLWAFALSIGMNGLNLRWPGELLPLMEVLGISLAPVGLIVVGLQLKWTAFKEFKGLLALGALYGLILSPLITWLIYQFAFDVQTLSVAIIMACLPPNITASIIASEHGLHPRLCSALVTVSTIAAAATIPAWYLFTGLL